MNKDVKYIYVYTYIHIYIYIHTHMDSMDCSLPGSSAYGIFQARVLEWGAIAFSKDTETT